MATILSEKISTYDGPHAYYTFTLTVTERNQTSITFKATCKGRLRYDSSWLGTGDGYGLQAGIKVGSGDWVNWTLKGESTSWSGTAWKATKETTFTVSTGITANTSNLTVKVRVRRSARNSGSRYTAASLSETTISGGFDVAKYKWTISFKANSATLEYDSVKKANNVEYNPYNNSVSGMSTFDYNAFYGWGESDSTFTAAANKNYTATANKTWYVIRKRACSVSLGAKNGWSGGAEAGSGNALYNCAGNSQAYTYTISSTVPTKTGYTFTGYTVTRYNKDGSVKDTTTVQPGGTITLYGSYPTASIAWQTGTANTYTITLDGVSVDKTYSATYNGTTPASVSVDTQSNKKFLGWFTASSGGTKVFSATGAKVTGNSYWDSNGKWIYAGNVKLYPQWGTPDKGVGPIEFCSDGTVKAAQFVVSSNRLLRSDGVIEYPKFTKSGSTIIFKSTELVAKDFIIQ